MQQREMAQLVDSIEDDRDDIYVEPSYLYKKKNYRWFKIYSKYGDCDCFNMTLSFGRVTILKPFSNGREVNRSGKRLDKKCIYLVLKEGKYNKRFSVPYKNYIDEDRAFDSSMKSLIRLAKLNLTRTSR